MDTLNGLELLAIVGFAFAVGSALGIFVTKQKDSKPKTGGQMPFDGPSGPRAEE
jgi:hypothetical protein